jgi:hypothetical protein
MHPVYAVKLFMALTISCLACTASANERITGDALRVLHADKTWEMTHVKQGDGLIYFAPDGALAMLRGGKTQTGKWWIDDVNGMRCGQWDGRKPFCLAIQSAGEGKYVAVDENGSRQVDVHKIMDGNQIPR